MNTLDLSADIQAGLGYLLYGDEADGLRTADVLCVIEDDTHALVALDHCPVAEFVCIECEEIAWAKRFTRDAQGLLAWHASIYN